MIHHTLAEALKNADIKWTIDGVHRYPNEDDVQDALDRLAEKLYDASTGDRLSIGGLVVEKTHFGHDVYVYMGEFI